MNSYTTLGQLRILAISEGISYLLLGITMPLKYSLDMGWPNKIIGMIHGVLFVLYCLWVIRVSMQRKWSLGKTAVSLLASLFPFATFIVDAKILKKEG